MSSCTSYNGRLNSTVLASIKGGTYLRKDAAAAWNAMYDYIYQKTGEQIRTNGNDSAYRVISRQHYWRRYWCGRGSCGNAASPGCSNHGLGLAVDVSQRSRQLIDRYGEPFGWAKKWSDASHEWWHLKWREGVWKPGNYVPEWPGYLKKGSNNGSVAMWQRQLHDRWGYKIGADGDFGDRTYKITQDFQSKHSLNSDGVVGRMTWDAAFNLAVLTKSEKAVINELQKDRAELTKIRIIVASSKISSKAKWGSSTDPDSYKFKAEALKVQIAAGKDEIRHGFMPAIRGAVRHDIQKGMNRGKAWNKHYREERYQYLKDVHGPPF